MATLLPVLLSIFFISNVRIKISFRFLNPGQMNALRAVHGLSNWCL